MGLLPGANVLEQERKKSQRRAEKERSASTKKTRRPPRGCVGKEEAQEIATARSVTRKAVAMDHEEIFEFHSHIRSSDALNIRESVLAELTPYDRLKVKLDAFVLSSRFDGIMGVLVAVNALVMGLEYELRGDDAKNAEHTFMLLDLVFLMAFLVELCLRIRVLGLKLIVTTPALCLDLFLQLAV